MIFLHQKGKESEYEQNQVDGTLAQTIERFIFVCAYRLGYQVRTCSGVITEDYPNAKKTSNSFSANKYLV